MIHVTLEIANLHSVNPARAGMIPWTETLNSLAASKPRASGDDPWMPLFSSSAVG